MTGDDGAVASPRPRFPRVLAGPVRSLFRSLSAVRGDRIVHPQGAAFDAELSLAAPISRSGLLARPGTHAATVRLSRAAGLPERVPDVLGIALRVVDAYGPDRPQDFLLVSSSPAVGGRHALVPGWRGFTGHFFSTLLPYRLEGRVRVIGLEPVTRRPSPHALEPAARRTPGNEYVLVAAPLTGPWERLGTLRIGARRTDAQAEALRFDPWNTGPDLYPVGPFAGIRAPAYAGSREGRPAV